MKEIIDFILHIDVHLIEILNVYGIWATFIIFLIIFAETGLVVMPLLPGDSLIFAVGALTAKGGFNLFLIYLVMILAAVLGDAVNYFFGHKIGRKAFTSSKVPFINHEHLMKAEKFYEKHGGKTIIIARFMPIIRTFAPFVAGIGKMKYREFLSYNIIGAIAWVTLFLFTGYFFGNIPFIEENFSLVIMAIILVSLLPSVVHYIYDKVRTAKNESNSSHSS